MSAQTSLDITVSQIPPEGRALDEDLNAERLHVDGKEGFVLRPGGRVSGRVERGEDDSVHVTGHLAVRMGLACDRCAEPYELDVDQEIELYSLPHRPDGAAEDEDDVELTDRDMVVSYHREDHVPLGELLREQLVLAVPMSRLCGEACQGLCPQCGANRNEVDCGCAVEESESPFAALKGMFGGRSH